MATRSDEHYSLSQLLEAIQAAIDPAGMAEAESHLPRQFGEMLDKLEKLPEDEKKKLRAKDEALQIGLNSIVRAILRADHLPQGTARILLAIVLSLQFVEEILKELKMLHGIEPGHGVELSGRG